ncbi:PIR protein CIR protein [Plasmodium vinckei lentum]|uniref:PIR protein CIR protein n=1 Tax=Plasmodium vinckei lentum TaxID=138297 RepID=A0A6V7S0M6_PLAVN|nr:PIR protein CIR protein [Plasmodium vinckei lentum]
MIWIGSKLFKMDNDYKATLEESYKKHLENIIGNVNYWEIISEKLYKNATIRKMDELYSLLDNICKLITEYNKKPTNPNRKSLGNHAVQCRNFYKTIHKSINGCRPYLHLLDSVKMMYENFRWNQIVNNNNLIGNNKKLLLNSIQPLTTFNDENKLFVPVAANLSFGDKECLEAKSKDEQIGKSIASQKSKNLDRGTQTRVPGNPHRGNTRSTKLPTKPAPPHSPVLKPPERPHAKPPVQKSTQQSQPPSSPQTPQKSEADHQSGAKGSDSKKGNKGDGFNAPGGAVSRPESSEGKSKDAGQKKPNPVGTPSPGPKEGSKPTGLKNQGSGTDGQVAKGSQGSSSSGIDGGRGNVQGDQGGSGNQAKHSRDSSHVNPAPASSGAGTPQSSGTTPSPIQPSASQSPPVSQPSSVSPESQPQPQQKPADSLPKDSLPTGSPPTVQQSDSSLQPSDPKKPDLPPQPPTADPAAPAQDGRSSQTSQTGGSSNQNEQKDSRNSKGGTGGTKDNKGDPNDGSKGPGDGSSDPASSASGGSFDWGSSIFESILKGKEYYDKAFEFIKDNQQKFKDAAEKISGAYNQAKDNLKTTYDQSNKYLNKLINDVIDQFNKNDTPSKSNDKQPGPGSPMGEGNKSNQSPSNPQQNPPPFIPPASPKGPQSNSPPTPSKDLLQQKQSSSQPKPITQHLTQVNQLNHQKIGQLVKSLSFNPNLKKTWNTFPTTWNGSGDCKPEIKFMNVTLVCCTSEQCSLTGILITLVLIPIILSIAYKYLSFGSSKKSEKKNMKRVINFHDGNRKTKIIISSNDRSKHLKPVINSVDGKKDSLLNIYKLIRADSMPFINLFFLLIFFVYKRKRDTIE